MNFRVGDKARATGTIGKTKVVHEFVVLHGGPLGVSSEDGDFYAFSKYFVELIERPEPAWMKAKIVKSGDSYYVSDSRGWYVALGPDGMWSSFGDRTPISNETMSRVTNVEVIA